MLSHYGALAGPPLEVGGVQSGGAEGREAFTIIEGEPPSARTEPRWRVGSRAAPAAPGSGPAARPAPTPTCFAHERYGPGAGELAVARLAEEAVGVSIRLGDVR